MLFRSGYWRELADSAAQISSGQRSFCRIQRSDVMELVIKCLALSVVMSFSCKLFFETLIPLRKWEHRWIEKTIIPAFVSAFMIISFSEVPPYIFQALRLILAISIITQIYYKICLLYTSRYHFLSFKFDVSESFY